MCEARGLTAGSCEVYVTTFGGGNPWKQAKNQQKKDGNMLISHNREIGSIPPFICRSFNHPF